MESERVKYSAIGGAMLMTTGLALVSGQMVFYQIFYPGSNHFEFLGTPWRFFSSLVFAVAWTLVLYNMQRFLVFGSSRDTAKATVGLQDVLHTLPGLVLSSLIGLTIATPLQVLVFAPEIDSQLVLERGRNVDRALRAIDDRFERQTRNLLESALRVGVPLARIGSSMSFNDKGCYAAAISEQMPAEPGELPVGRCVDYYGHLSAEFFATLTELGADPSHARSVDSSELEIRLNEAQLRHEKLLALLGAQQEPGLLERAALAYKVDSLFCWVLLLAAIFVQAAPVLIRTVTPKGPYDDLVQIHAREVLAGYGIEPAAVYLFPNAGAAVPVDRFHLAKRMETEILRQLRAERSRLREERLNLYRERFSDLQANGE
jgi:hypothetical protein